jgi:ketopantoate hydroxymethyltransferase
MLKAFGSFREEVSRGEFPTDQHSFHIEEKELNKISS